MSLPKLPDVNPEVDIGIDDAINLLLVSIAFEELGLAQVISAEAEKIQFVVGTLHKKDHCSKEHHKHAICPTIEDLKEIDRSVDSVLKDIIKKEIILEFKLENIIQLIKLKKSGKCTTKTDKCAGPFDDKDKKDHSDHKFDLEFWSKNR